MRRDRPVLVERLLLRLARAMRGVSATALYTSLGFALVGVALYFALLVRGGATHFFVGLLLGAWIVGTPVVYAARIAIASRWRERWPRLKGILLGNAVFFAALCCAHIAGSKVIAWRLNSWMRDGEEIAAAIDAHRARTGAFPRSLNELPPRTPRPPARWFSYSPLQGGTFTLTIRNPRSLMGWDGWEFKSDSRAWKRFWD